LQLTKYKLQSNSSHHHWQDRRKAIREQNWPQIVVSYHLNWNLEHKEGPVPHKFQFINYMQVSIHVYHHRQQQPKKQKGGSKEEQN
jgi:hypothetical protein